MIYVSNSVFSVGLYSASNKQMLYFSEKTERREFRTINAFFRACKCNVWIIDILIFLYLITEKSSNHPFFIAHYIYKRV